MAGNGVVSMKNRDLLLLVALTYLITAAIIWVRINIAVLKPILEESTLFFQLIVAATVIAALRNIVGIKTFGVFGPVIIALGMLGSGLLWGFALYIDVFLISMFTSLALYSLGMPSNHRLAIIITTTVITITILELFAELYHVDVLQESILFPVLITSWLADRYVKLVKEIDWINPSKRLFGTFFVVLLSFGIINYRPLIVFIALNPETWGMIIALNVVLALKVNYRLTEHLRFRSTISFSRSRGGSRKDVMTLNNRNRDLVFKYNPANLFPSITKDKMKVTFHHLGVPTPETYAIIQEKRDLDFAEKIMKEKESFVIKPSGGLGGEGILVVDRADTDSENEGRNLFRAKGRSYSVEELKNHIKMILDGQYSSDWEDVAILEEKVVTDPKIADFYWKGVPDFRVIVLEGFPVMAMARLPTKESGGAANLHKGGIGMGLNISDGKGVNPYWPGHGGSVERHPDTGAVLVDMEIPDWEKLLQIASLAQGASRLGYAGVDIVLDLKGPMVLEVNKRPGLEIQNTNLSGLLKRVRYIEENLQEFRFRPVSEKVRLSMEWDRRGWE